MPSPDAATERYLAALFRQRNAVAAFLATLWSSLEQYGEDGEEQFITTAEPRLQGHKRATVSTSAAYFALALGVRPVGVDAKTVGSVARLRDPFLAARHAVAAGRPWVEAVQAGQSMAEAVGYNFVQSTARRTGDVVAQESGVDVLWRRLPSANACDWCKTVAGQLYNTSESADFGHDRDGCLVVPTNENSVSGITRTTQRGQGRRALGIASHRSRR